MAKKKITELVTIEQKAIAQPAWSEEQVQLIKNTVAKGATDDELKLFLYTAQRTGLDPLTRQIHFVKRGDKMTIQTGIDGYRAIAERTGQLAGIDDAIYEEKTTSQGHFPMKATVSVYRVVKGLRVAFTASARWAEYAPQGNQGFMWNKMPYLMLGKVAEALALRKAFPLNLSGLYTSEEMDQADTKATNVQVIQPESNLSLPQPPEKQTQPIKKELSAKTKIVKLCEMLNIAIDAHTPEKVRAFVGLEFVEENYEEIINRLETIVKDNNEARKNQ